jgi:hypothetical protein
MTSVRGLFLLVAVLIFGAAGGLMLSAPAPKPPVPASAP